MNTDELTIGQFKEISSLLSQGGGSVSPCIGSYCVVRTYSAGVHIGIVERKDGTNVVLTKARRLYHWSGAFTLSAVAVAGIEKGKMSCVVPIIELTEAIELIPCSADAQRQLLEYPEHGI